MSLLFVPNVALPLCSKRFLSFVEKQASFTTVRQYVSAKLQLFSETKIEKIKKILSELLAYITSAFYS